MSEGVRRLSFIVGTVPSLIWIMFCTFFVKWHKDFAYIGIYHRDDVINQMKYTIGGTLLIFLLGWGVVRLIYWIYAVFKIDITKKEQIPEKPREEQ